MLINSKGEIVLLYFIFQFDPCFKYHEWIVIIKFHVRSVIGLVLICSFISISIGRYVSWARFQRKIILMKQCKALCLKQLREEKKTKHKMRDGNLCSHWPKNVTVWSLHMRQLVLRLDLLLFVFNHSLMA